MTRVFASAEWAARRTFGLTSKERPSSRLKGPAADGQLFGSMAATISPSAGTATRSTAACTSDVDVFPQIKYDIVERARVNYLVSVENKLGFKDANLGLLCVDDLQDDRGTADELRPHQAVGNAAEAGAEHRTQRRRNLHWSVPGHTTISECCSFREKEGSMYFALTRLSRRNVYLRGHTSGEE